MATNCQICDYAFNKSIRKSIDCPYCAFTACKTCCERYILGETTVKCMNGECGRAWTRQHIKDVFPNSFITGKLKDHRESVLFDIERSLLPATQPIVEREIQIENLMTRETEVRRQVQELQIAGYRLSNEIRTLRYGNAPVERQEFIRGCPDSNCRGFLSTQWKCGVCEKWACNRCHEIKGVNRDDPHECNPETVATVSLLANDTRPCPNCRTGIHKIDGCDQMFCTSCNTAFDWRTGRIETRVIHNPHYFEWMRRNGGEVPRNPGDVPCRRELTHQTARTIIRSLKDRHSGSQLYTSCEEMISRVIRNVAHIRYTVLANYDVGRDWTARNQALRVAYMRNRLEEQEFKRLLQRSEKKAEKSREIYNVLDLLLNTVTDIVLRFEQHITSCALGMFEMTILQEIPPIVEYANGCLLEISKAYNSKRISFSNELTEQ